MFITHPGGCYQFSILFFFFSSALCSTEGERERRYPQEWKTKPLEYDEDLPLSADTLYSLTNRDHKSLLEEEGIREYSSLPAFNVDTLLQELGHSPTNRAKASSINRNLQDGILQQSYSSVTDGTVDDSGFRYKTNWPETQSSRIRNWRQPTLGTEMKPEFLLSSSPSISESRLSILLSEMQPPVKNAIKKRDPDHHVSAKRWWGNYNYRPRPQMDRRAAQSKHYGCLKRCITAGKLHPIQCHTLC